LYRSTSFTTKQFQILHATVPIADDKWGSYYIALKERVMMSEGEYSTFPYSISRYSTSPEEVFGRGPAMQALADVKRLNKIIFR
jgi:hypothetical protein